MRISEGISSHSFAEFLLKSFSRILICLFLSFPVAAQLADDFSDGEFSTNPAWQGNNEKFLVSSSMLRLSAPLVNDVAYLSTSSHSINNAVWEFFIRLDFNPSSTNFSRFYLVSDNADLRASLNGYFVMVGNTQDEVSLYQQTGLTRTKIIDGVDGRLNLATCLLRVKVTRDDEGNWELFSDVGNTGNFIAEGVVNDTTHISSAYAGIYCEYTSTRSDKFYFDDIVITGQPYTDTVAPTLQSVTDLSSDSLLLTFSESVNETSARTLQNYLLNGSTHPAKAHISENKVWLVFTDAFENGRWSTLTVSDVEDLSSNIMQASTFRFFYFEAAPVQTRDIIVTEIFPDFSPSVGLPEAEFIELFNRSHSPISLANWTLTDGNSVAVLKDSILHPGEYLIITGVSNISVFSSIGQTMGVSNFPTLNNSGDYVILRDAEGTTIDSLYYFLSWYGDADKAEGGWTLERINREDFCREGDNWTASVAGAGGTPGQQNAVDDNTVDVTGPALLNTSVQANVVMLNFNERLDATKIPSINIVPGLAFNSFFITATSIEMRFQQDPEPGKMYEITVDSVYDCPGNITLAVKAFVNYDTLKPYVSAHALISENEIILHFSERVERHSVESTANFQRDGSANPSVVEILDDLSVKLVFASPFSNGVASAINILQLIDINGNASLNIVEPFTYFVAHPVAYKDVIINEILPDPSPSAGLPEAEFVELFNRGENPISLQNWKLTDGTSTSVIPTGILLPGEFVIICHHAHAEAFRPFGKTLAVPVFPTLNNSGDRLILFNEAGLLIDSLTYSVEWYSSDEADGGVSLELIDPTNTCSDARNWAASESSSGGTPGLTNSIHASKPDISGPRIVSVKIVADTLLEVTFDERLASRPLVAADFIIEPVVQISEVSFTDSSLIKIRMKTSPFSAGILYSIRLKNVQDCPGNFADETILTSFAKEQDAAVSDVVINEILFNPNPSGVDFIEVVNRSAKFINLQDWKIGNGTDTEIISGTDLILAPLAYKVFTVHSTTLASEYPSSNTETFFEMDLPSMNDDEGNISLIDRSGIIIDQFSYNADMHSVFIKNDEGVSLERLSVNQPAVAENWHSASSASFYATPGLPNSSAIEDPITTSTIRIEPEVFQPMSARQSFTLIYYSFHSPGNVANIKIFDSQGRMVKTLVSNEILDTEGFLRWEGDRDDGRKASFGYYLVWTEVFNASGSVSQFKNRVAIAADF